MVEDLFNCAPVWSETKLFFGYQLFLMRFWISFLGWLIRKEHGTSAHYNSAANGNNSITSIISYNNTGGTLWDWQVRKWGDSN